MLILIFFAVFSFILTFGIKFAGFKEQGWHEDFLSLKNTKAIQGFMALLIVIHHLSQTNLLRNNPYLIWCNDIGVLLVGIFLFCSGYGVIKSLNTKENYLKGFLKTRLTSVLIPFYTMNSIFLVIAIVTKSIASPLDFIGNVTGIFLLNDHSWYIFAIVLFYLVFYLLFKFVGNEGIAFTGMGIFFIFYITLSLLAGHGLTQPHGPLWFQGEWWYNTSLLFFVGMVVAKFEKPIISFVKKTYYFLLPLIFISFILFYFKNLYMLRTYSYWAEFSGVPGIREKWLCLTWQIPTIILFVFTVILITMKFQFRNVVLDFFGSICIELYLIHNLFILLFSSPSFNITNNILYVLLVYAGSIPLATLLHFINQKLINLVVKKKKSPSTPNPN